MSIKRIYRSAKAAKEIESAYNGILKSWPLSYQERIVETRHGKTYVLAFGKAGAPSLILLHGANSNSSFWLGEAQQFSESFMVYAIDIPGEPGKSFANRMPYNTPAYAEWLLDVFGELDIEKAVLLGVSQGGWTALRFATCFPASVHALILLAPAGVIATKSSFVTKALLLSLFGKSGLKRVNRMVLGKQRVDNSMLKYMDLILAGCVPRIDKEYIFTNIELQKLGMPVLLIAGNEDIVRDSEAIKNRLGVWVKNLEVIIRENVGHVVFDIHKEVISFSERWGFL